MLQVVEVFRYSSGLKEGKAQMVADGNNAENRPAKDKLSIFDEHVCDARLRKCLE